MKSERSEDIQHISGKRPQAGTKLKPCLQRLQSTRGMVQALPTDTWQGNKQEAIRQILISSHFLNKTLNGHLVLHDAKYTIAHPCASRRDSNSPSLFLTKQQNVRCKHSEVRPHKVLELGTTVCPCRRGHRVVVNLGKSKRSHGTPAPQCQCSSTG